MSMIIMAARELDNKYRPEEGIQLLSNEIKKNADYNLIRARADLLYKNGNYKEASDDYEKLVEMDNKITDIINLANIYLKMEKYNKALINARRAFEMDNKNIDARHVYGYVLIKLEKYWKAFRFFTAKDGAMGQFNKGICFLGVEKAGSAIKRFNKTLQINPDYKYVNMYKACAYVMKNNLPKALNLINIELSMGEDSNVLHQKGRILSMMDLQYEAVDCLKQSIEYDKENPDLMKDLCELLYKCERYEECVKNLEPFVMNLELYMILLESLVNLREIEKMKNICKKILNLDNYNKRALDLLNNKYKI